MRRSLKSIGSTSARSGLHARVLEGIVTDLPPANNSTIVPVVFSSDRQTYYALAGVGSVSLRLALDTASADLWLVSSGCTSSACNIPKYPLAFESSTFVPVNSNGTTFNVTYADSTGAQGFIARESVTLGNLTVANQALGLANASTVHFTDSMSGVLGLGFPRLSTIGDSAVNATPFFATMAQNGQLDYPLFGLSLTRDSSGTLALGAIDGSVVTNRSLVEWNEVVPFAPFLSDSNSNASSYLQWALVLENISVNGTAVTPEPTYPTQTLNSSIALFDVGTAGIYGPYQDVSRMYALIDGARLVDDSIGQWVVPCDTEQTMSFNFGGQDFVLQPTDYMIGPASGNPNLCLSWPRASNPSSDGIDWQLGSPFLRTVYSIYSFGINNKESPMVGLFPLANASAPIEPSASVSAFLASYSATVGTTLPNFLIPTPSPTAPAYTFNTSVSATRGQIVKTGLATSTYVALLASKHQNATALPAITPSPTVATLVITDTSGHTLTSVSTAATPSITLGVPEGWTQNGARPLAAHTGASWGVAAVLCALAWGVL
ncbi:acid protease [Trametes versicolor FP-101664 SS1]|uniref:acid protease n=1 Tax=Trametes versicolor (strain FP-101664) TaxID=717944 RepID=UPI0004622973|nr:acid protease [Trametes versicolor FP-101664 SS1]EIW57558.1 acid protease [Trametes versicolor FP-101664 SS1]